MISRNMLIDFILRLTLANLDINPKNKYFLTYNGEDMGLSLDVI